MLLQVKEYNATVARRKYENAFRDWQLSNGFVGYPSKSMFYFMLEDEDGTERSRGWVVYNDTGAKWYKNKQLALNNC